jgi:hypothetical protein
MYIEHKAGGTDTGPARIGRVKFSKTGRTLTVPVEIDADVREEYWGEIRGRRRRA